VQLHLIQSDLAIAPDHPNAGTRVNHMSFNVRNFAECEKRLQAAHIKYEKVYVPVGKVGINQLFFQDPDMHWIELCDCDRFNEFIFGEYDENRAYELAEHYCEGGSEAKSSFAAALLLLIMCWPRSVEVNAPPVLQCVFEHIAGSDFKLDLLELRSVLLKITPKMSIRAARDFLHDLDVNGDGFVSFSEFIVFLQEYVLSQPTVPLIRDIFNCIDIDGSNSLTSADLLHLARSLEIPCPELHIFTIFSIDRCDSSGTIISRGDCSCVLIEEFSSIFSKFVDLLRAEISALGEFSDVILKKPKVS
jgi:Ca2+-binding EF-hand superfamily protein